jgi:hypothetical protein
MDFRSDGSTAIYGDYTSAELQAERLTGTPGCPVAFKRFPYLQ